jgi:hypothetical protein
LANGVKQYKTFFFATEVHDKMAIVLVSDKFSPPSNSFGLDKIYTKSTTGTKHLLISQRKRKKIVNIIKKNSWLLHSGGIFRQV